MSNQLPMAIEPSLIPYSECNFVGFDLEGQHHPLLSKFIVETNHKVFGSDIVLMLGISHEWCTNYIGGEQNYIKCQLPPNGVNGYLNCIWGITYDQLMMMWTKAKNTRADKYKPILSELIMTQILPLFNTQSQIKHDDFKREIDIMTTNQLINIQQQTIGNDTVNAVSARELHKFLESKREFTHWVKPYVSADNDYGFIENIDFIAVDVGVNRISQQVMKDYWFTIDMAKEVSMLSKTAKGKEARKYFIECEKKTLSPTSALPNFADPAAAAIAWAAEYKEKERIQLELKQIETQITEDKPYTKLGKIMTMVEATIMIGEYAIMLQNNHKIKIGQNRLFEWLRENGYLCKDGKFKNRPTQKSMDLELFAWTERVITTNHGEEIISFTPRITGKGQAYFIDKLTRDFSPDAA